MFRRLILMVVVLGFSTTLFGEVNPDTLPEKYVPKIIIEGELSHNDSIASLPGNFSIKGEEYDAPQPRDMEIDKEGNIYIFDPMNNRIQKFDNNGKYLKSIPIKDCLKMSYGPNGNLGIPITEHNKEEFAIDNEGNIYVLDTGQGDIEGWKEGIGLVNKRGELIIEDSTFAYVYKTSRELIKLNQKGEEIERILLPREIDGKEIHYSESKLEADEEGRVFMIGKTSDGAKIMKIEKRKKITIESSDFPRTKGDIRYIATQGYNPKEFVKSISKKEKELKIGTRKIKVVDASRIFGIAVLGEDKWGNIFVAVSAWEGFKIKKYSTEGTLVATIQVSPSSYWSDNTYKRMIDSFGNYYELQSKNHKLRVVKWERRKK